MIHPRIDELLDRVEESRYALVIVAAKRARQINNYHHQLGEGIGFEEAPPPLIESRGFRAIYKFVRRYATNEADVRMLMSVGKGNVLFLQGDREALLQLPR